MLVSAMSCGGGSAQWGTTAVDVPLEPPEGQVVVPSGGLDADLAATQAFFSTRARFEQPLDASVDAVPGLADLSAATCGTCHKEIYDEWRVSTHAAAWTDPQFQEEIKKSDNRWLCLNCHTPLLVQREFWPQSLVDEDVERPVLSPNPLYDASLREEGITCAACHVVQGKIHGPGLPDSNAPHGVEADARFRGVEICTRCHEATATYPGKDFVCTFETGAEFAASPQAKEGQTCQTCHMPLISRPAALGGPVREVRQHWWRGAGIPKFAGTNTPPGANRPGVSVATLRVEDRLEVTLTNANAGHRLPTGDPERWIQLDVQLSAADGVDLGDPKSWRIGQTWEWNPPKKLGDNRLLPGESRTYVIEIPDGARRAKVKVSSHRMTPKAASYHGLEETYPLSVTTWRGVVELD